MNFPYITHSLYEKNVRYRSLVDHMENMLESYTLEGLDDALELAKEHYKEHQKEGVKV